MRFVSGKANKKFNPAKPFWLPIVQLKTETNQNE